MKKLLPLLLFATAALGQQVNKPAGTITPTSIIGPTDSMIVTTGITARSTRLINTSNLLESLAQLTNWSTHITGGSQTPIVQDINAAGKSITNGNIFKAAVFTDTGFSANGVVTNDATGQLYTSVFLPATMMGTNCFIAPGSNVTITTNYSNGVFTYTIASTGGGSAAVAPSSTISISTNGAVVTPSVVDPLTVTELDVTSLFATNLFTLKTNLLAVGTDANGKLTSITNVPANVGLFGPASGGSGAANWRFMSAKDMATNVYNLGSASVSIVTNINADGSISYTYTASTGAATSTNAITQVGTNNNVNGNQITNLEFWIGTPAQVYWWPTNVGGREDISATVSNIPNAALQNSTVGIAGTANQIASSTASPALGGSTTLSIPSVFIAPGTIAATTGITNQAFSTVGVVTNDANGKLYSTALLDPALLNLIRATNNDALVTNHVWLVGGYATNNDTVVSNALWNLLNASTNTDFAYARTIGGLATNRVDYASNLLWLTITNNYLAAGDSSVTITTNRSGQNVVWSIISNAGGSGTGIQTNNGTGTNNIFSNPILQGAPGSTDSNILYISAAAGPTNWVFRTNGDLVNLGPGSPYGLISSGAMTNAAGSRVGYLADTTNSTNDMMTVVKTFTNGPIFVTPGNGIGMSTNGNTVTIATKIQATDSSIVITTNSGVLSIQSTASASGTGIQTNNGTGTNNAFTTTKFLSVPGVQLANVTDSQVTVQTNFQMSSVGGAKMQRIFSDGSTNGFMTVINALDYGVVPGAGGDQRALIQAALDAGLALNQTVYLPAGDYIISGSLYIGRQALVGDSTPQSSFGTRLIVSGTNPAIIYKDSGFLVRSIQIYGSATGYTGGGIGMAAAITNYPSNTSYGTIEHCYIKKCAIGVYVNYGWTILMLNDYVQYSTIGIQATNYGNEIKIIGGNYIANQIAFDLRGDGSHSVDSFYLNSDCEGNSNVFRILGGGSGVRSIRAVGCYFEGNTNVFYAAAGKSISVKDCFFGDTLGSTACTNLIFVGVNNVSVKDNYFFNGSCNLFTDTTSTGESGNNFQESGGFFKIQSTAWKSTDSTNIVLTGGAYYGKSALTNAAGSADAFMSDVLNATNDLSGVLKTRMDNGTNDLLTTAKTFTNETTLRAYVTNLDQTILTPATATNTMPLYGGFWRLVISTPAAITNLTGVTAGEYRYSTLVLSNSLGTDLTNYLLINAIPMGYAATNSVAILGKNAYVVPNKKQVRLLIDCEGINQTNWAIISQ